MYFFSLIFRLLSDPIYEDAYVVLVYFHGSALSPFNHKRVGRFFLKKKKGNLLI